MEKSSRLFVLALLVAILLTAAAVGMCLLAGSTEQDDSVVASDSALAGDLLPGLATQISGVHGHMEGTHFVPDNSGPAA